MLNDASRYEILYDLPTGEYNRAEVGGIRTRTVRAGDTVEVECYPLTRIGARAMEEAVKRKHQRACQEKLNRKNAEKKIRRYINQNFTRNAYVLTNTWDYGRIDRFTMSEADADRLWEKYRFPVDEEDAKRALRNYFKRIKNRMRRKGEDPKELKYIYVLEITKPKVGGNWHYHFHMVIEAPGITADDLEQLWPQGFAQAHRLSHRDEGAARIAHYITKSHTTEEVTNDGRRLRRWDHSKNLVKPTETVSDRKLSRRRAALIAADVQANGVAIFESLYPGYQCVETPRVFFSDFVAGAYIYARLRKIDTAPPWERSRGNRDIERPENSPVDCFQRDGAGRPIRTGNREQGTGDRGQGTGGESLVIRH